ncbi:MAG: hypothetical protein AMJ46_11450 [Latescibacteria bacterium DG_63]|nr:MAG: hypothetical protein AMJ46_11450 [Latescibacteria bacterium DG_63]
MKANRIIIGALVLCATVILGSAGDGFAEQGRNRFGGPHHGNGLLSGLTSEQREAVRALRTEMRESGATREEIHTAVGEMLKSYGVELPENWDEKPLGDKGPGRRFFSNLTEEQKEAIRGLRTEMKEADATREEIHAAVGEMLKSYGVQLPENWDEKPLGDRGPGRRFFSKLTDQQREAIHAKVAEMRESGATREEIRATVREMLRNYGVDLPERPKRGPSERSDDASSATAGTRVSLVSRNYPNPFNPVTHISYTTDVAGQVRVQIYSVEGDLIRTFDEGYRSKGNHSLSWDGRHANGKPAASGIYFYRVEVGQHSITNRMILLR